MAKLEVKKPFFIFNPKSYLYGEELLQLALLGDELAREYPVSIFVTAPFTDIANIAKHTQHIIVSAQHMSGMPLGRGMGYAPPEALYSAGARATFLNHAEHPLTVSELQKAMERADELGILTVVCADSIKEAEMITAFGPDIILCEPTELIGTGQTSDDSYIAATNEAIRKHDEHILIMQAAGISDENDVYRTIALGADGTGCTSGIVKAENPKEMFSKMVRAACAAYQER